LFKCLLGGLSIIIRREAQPDSTPGVFTLKVERLAVDAVAPESNGALAFGGLVEFIEGRLAQKVIVSNLRGTDWF